MTEDVGFNADDEQTLRALADADRDTYADFNPYTDTDIDLLGILNGHPKTDHTANRGASTITWLDQYELKEATYIDRPLLQADTFHLLGGRPGVGKGALCAYWVARCTIGLLYPEPRRVLWLSSEDDPSIDLGPRVEAAGGNRQLVGLIPHTFNLPNDAGWLHEQICAIADIGLVIIDPLSNHTGTANTDRESEVRNALMPLGVIAHETHVPILGIRHISTKEAKTGALSQILGSTAWIGVPRVVLAAVKDPTSVEQLHVHPIKGNRVPAGEAGQQFELVGRPLPGFAETVVAAQHLGASQVDIDSLLAGQSAPSTKHAEDIILRLLGEADGAMESDALDHEVAKQTGLTVSTLRKVRSVLKDQGAIRHVAERDEAGAIQQWRVELTRAISDKFPARGGMRSSALLSFAGKKDSEPLERQERSSDLQGKSAETPPQRTRTTRTHQSPRENEVPF